MIFGALTNNLISIYIWFSIAYLTAEFPKLLKLSHLSSEIYIRSVISYVWYYLYISISFKSVYTISIIVLLMTIEIGSISKSTFSFLSAPKLKFISNCLLSSIL